MAIPREIRTARLLLRPWRPDDAEALCPILETNFEHLGPWIPARVATPAPVPELEQRLAGFTRDFDDGREWRFALFTRQDEALLGELALFPRSPTGRVPFPQADRVELGYWIRQDTTGRGLVTEAAQALIAIVAGMSEFSHVEIRCDARNRPSAAIPERLGFSLAETTDSPSVAIGAPNVDLQIWTLDLAPLRDGVISSNFD